MNVYTSLITTTTSTKTKSCTNKEWSPDVTHTNRYTVTTVTCRKIMHDGTHIQLYTYIQLVQISPRLLSIFQYKLKIHIEATCACAGTSTCILLSLSLHPPTRTKRMEWKQWKKRSMLSFVPNSKINGNISQFTSNLWKLRET